MIVRFVDIGGIVDQDVLFMMGLYSDIILLRIRVFAECSPKIEMLHSQFIC